MTTTLFNTDDALTGSAIITVTGVPVRCLQTVIMKDNFKCLIGIVEQLPHVWDMQGISTTDNNFDLMIDEGNAVGWILTKQVKSVIYSKEKFTKLILYDFNSNGGLFHFGK
jgi:hypothetical protein